MKYIQLLGLSTGYVEGTIPPRFINSNIKAIDMLGTSSRIVLDGRYSLETCINKGFEHMQKHSNTIGFKVVSASDYRECGKILYQHINDAKLKEAQK